MKSSFTHLGHRVQTGNLRLHVDNTHPGVVHALNATADRGIYESLCGIKVALAYYDLDENVWEIQSNTQPTCQKCQIILGEGSLCEAK